jgi:hypothetical protein
MYLWIGIGVMFLKIVYCSLLTFVQSALEDLSERKFMSILVIEGEAIPRGARFKILFNFWTQIL